MQIMIDLETLDTTPTCVILSIGAVIFDPKSNGIIDRIELKPTIEEQTDLGRTISDATIQWWSTQSQEAQDEAFSNEGRIPFRECMEIMYKFCWNRAGVWSNGAAFDVVAMETAFTSLGIAIPWKFWTVRDTRTLYDVTGVSLKDDGHVTTHKAVEDAEWQALMVQKGYKKLMKAGLVSMPR